MWSAQQKSLGTTGLDILKLLKSTVDNIQWLFVHSFLRRFDKKLKQRKLTLTFADIVVMYENVTKN